MNIPLFLILVFSQPVTDLFIVGILPQDTLKVGQCNRIRIQLGYKGHLTAKTLQVSLHFEFHDGHHQSHTTIIRPHAGNIAPVWFNFIPLEKAGEVTLTVTVDPSNRIRETQEKNNSRKHKTIIRGTCT